MKVMETEVAPDGVLGITAQPNAKDEQKLLILIVDDDKTNRLILSTLIKKLGYQITTANNGEEAISVFNEKQPDIVLMDVMMPVMNGYDASVVIKQSCHEKFVPIIFLTAITDEKALAKCIEYGGDDFITKPYNGIIIKAKIDAMVRVRELYYRISDSKAEIEEHHNRLQLEHEIADTIFSNITNPESLNIDNIRYFLKPMSITSGDILLCSRTPSGGLHIMLGDFTGHGLSAAIGAMPVSDTFYNFSSKGYSIGDLVYNINKKLKETLPSGFFCAACLIEADPDFRTVAVWNGGNPDVIITSGGRVIKRVPSTHLPLGVLDNESLDRSVEFMELDRGSKIYLYSDGVIEANNCDGEMYTRERLELTLEEQNGTLSQFDNVKHSIDKFCYRTEQSDDITFIEVTANELDESSTSNSTSKISDVAANHWNISIKLESDALASTNPCPLITQSIMEIQGLLHHRERIYTILSELFSNSLEHGILRLSSSMKDNPQGFIEYYKAREVALSELTDAYIVINVGHYATDAGGKLVVSIEDSGPGFNVDDMNRKMTDCTHTHGRGVNLLNSLCDQLTYYDNGKKVTAEYHWNDSSRNE